MEEKELTHEESLKLISTMLNKAKDNYHDNGVLSILWGTVVSVCSLITYCQIKGWFKLPFQVWMLTLVAVIPTIIIAIRNGRQAKAKHYDDKMMDYVWSVYGIGFIVIGFFINGLSIALNGVLTDYLAKTGQHTNFHFYEYTSAIYLFWYGVPTIITGGAKGFKPMLLGGVFCWVASIISIYTTADIDMLLMAAAAISSWLIPGIMLNRRYKKAHAANV